MFLQKAMRYYRFWIYSCNTALFIGTLVFIIAFVWILYDERMTLFSIRLYHPTLIYGYAALLFQAGFLQVRDSIHLSIGLLIDFISLQFHIHIMR